jgi:hypothetical protein
MEIPVEVDAWVMAARGCRVSCDVVGDQVQLQFRGIGTTGSLTLVLDESVTGQVATITTAVGSRLATEPAGSTTNFSITEAGGTEEDY